MLDSTSGETKNSRQAFPIAHGAESEVRLGLAVAVDDQEMQEERENAEQRHGFAL